MKEIRNHPSKMMAEAVLDVMDPTEGLNNKIKALKRQMYGFSNDEFFKLKPLALHDKRLRI